MRWYHGLFAIALVCLSLAALAQEDVASATSPDQSDQVDTLRLDAELRTFVDGIMATHEELHAAPGYSVAIVARDRVITARGYGYADVEAGLPVDGETTRFYVASISKTFVWTAAMLLVDRGQLALDRDVNDYLNRLSVPSGERSLTLNDLMTHRAGFEENLDLFTPEIAVMPIVEAMEASRPAQAFPRGERAAYSNWGSNLVALIIEDVTGEPFETFLYRELLTPLGMSTTVLTADSPNAEDTTIAKNYRVKATGPEVVPQIDLGAFAPIGGITTTAADMARWMRFHLNRGELDGVRLMSESTYALMRSRQFDEVPGGPSRAHGFADVPYRATTLYGHTGSINAFYSNFLVSPELGFGVFISQNTSDSFEPLTSVPHRVFDYLLGHRYGAFSLRPTPQDGDQALAEEIAGDYITNRRIFDGLLKVLAVFDGALQVSAQDGYLLTPNQPAYVRIDDDLWENREGSRLAVVRDADGNVLRLLGGYGSTHLEPVTFWTDPGKLRLAFLLTVLFAITTWLGLWRRLRQQREATTTGRVLSTLALLGIAPFIWMAVLSARVADVQNQSFAEIFADWPPTLVLWIATAATVAVVFAVALAIGLPFAWRRARWNIWRRLHYSAYALCYAFLAVMLINWHAAPQVPGITW
ncbi:MAG: serine hydrolase domain-containing protein [Pseudomonadota bacterium]